MLSSVLYSVGQTPDIPLPYTNNKQKSKDTLSYVILFNAKNLIFDSTCKTATLTKKEISDVEGLIKIRMKKLGSSEYKFSDYKRQIISATDKNGDKIVYINGFCRAPSYWKTDFVIVQDGGDCFYQTKINLTKRQILFFTYNGDA